MQRGRKERNRDEKKGTKEERRDEGKEIKRVKRQRRKWKKSMRGGDGFPGGDNRMGGVDR